MFVKIVPMTYYIVVIRKYIIYIYYILQHKQMSDKSNTIFHVGECQFI